MPAAEQKLGWQLVLDELFDLTFYQQVHRSSRGSTRRILEELIPVETRHLAFWSDFFKISGADLNFRRRIKLKVLVFACRLFGPTAVHLCLEAIEIYGIRKYLAAWDIYKDGPLGNALEEILRDEFQHEDSIVSGSTAQRMLRPDDVRSILLGLNDGLVEILGAVSGFFAAFSQPHLVLMAGTTVAVAGAISMGAGAFSASGSEVEILKIEKGRERFLGKGGDSDGEALSPLRTAFLVGLSYFLGALVPILPVVLGAHSIAIPIVMAGAILFLVSFILAFLSGMDASRRIVTNLLLMAAAVAITYGIGTFVRNVWGVTV